MTNETEDEMTRITNKSVLAYEVVDVRDTKHRVPVIVGMRGGDNPVIMTRKLYESADGRLFVLYRNNFHPVIAPEANDTAYHLGFGKFVRGAWHWEDGTGWVEGIAPDETDETDGNIENIVAEVTPAEPSAGNVFADEEFNLFDLLMGDLCDA